MVFNNLVFMNADRKQIRQLLVFFFITLILREPKRKKKKKKIISNEKLRLRGK